MAIWNRDRDRCAAHACPALMGWDRDRERDKGGGESDRRKQHWFWKICNSNPGYVR